MRAPYNYGFPGDVSYSPQNRVHELYYGNAPDARMEKSMRSIPSGNYLGAVGKTVNMAGLGCGVGCGGAPRLGALYAIPLREVAGTPVMRAAYEAGQLGLGSGIQMAALGDAASDRAACQATTGAMVGGAGIATSVHAGSAPTGGTPDQGWTTGLSIFTALATVANSMCGLIQGAGDVTSAPPGATPPPLPPATSSVPYGTSTGAAGTGAAGVPNWAIALGAALAGGAVAMALWKK